MEANQIKLFKYRGWPSNACDAGYAGWGNYVGRLQDKYGEYLTRDLTDCGYNDYYLVEVRHGS